MCLPLFIFVRQTDELDTLNCGKLRCSVVIGRAKPWKWKDDQLMRRPLASDR
jgi:hypothetical protein